MTNQQLVNTTAGGFDLSQVMNQAVQIKEKSNNNNNEGPRLVYPGQGVLKVKLLFNPGSGLVSRRVVRHNVAGTKVPCLGELGHTCPICQTMTAIQNSKGLDLWQMKASTRGISYAQYVGSEGYDWGQSGAPQVGELILLMYPWTIYAEINRIIADAGQQAEVIVAKNTGKILKISRWVEGNQTKYKAELDALGGDYQSFPTDDEFNKFLMNTPNLNDNKMMPTAVSDTLLAQAKDISEQLHAQYLGQVVLNPGAPQQQAPQQPVYTPNYQQQQSAPQYTPTYQPGGPVQQQQAPAQPQQQDQQQYQQHSQYSAPQGFNSFAPTAPVGSSGGASPVNSPQQGGGQQAPANAPACFGQSATNDPNMCAICPFEFQCKNM